MRLTDEQVHDYFEQGHLLWRYPRSSYADTNLVMEAWAADELGVWGSGAGVVDQRIIQDDGTTQQWQAMDLMGSDGARRRYLQLRLRR